VEKSLDLMHWIIIRPGFDAMSFLSSSVDARCWWGSADGDVMGRRRDEGTLGLVYGLDDQEV
jgi:hypothetical protein